MNSLLFLKEKPNTPSQKANLISVHYPFLAICLMGASAGNTRDVIFYLGVVIFSAIALWFARSPRTSAIAWLSVILLASTLGFFGHLTLHHAHLSLEKRTARWLRQFYHYHSSNPNQRNTAIGDIGAVKLSNKIILRVKPDANNLEPQLLRRITYNNYNSGIWVAVKSAFQPLVFQADKANFLPSKTKPTIQNKVTIYRSLEEEKNLLNLPDGTQNIERLPVDKITQNQYGAVQVELEKPSLLSYRVTYDSDIINDSPPTEEDLEIPLSELPALEKVLQELDLQSKSEREALDTVYNFFNTEFTYSLELARQGFSKTPLSAFLLEHRSGHCEYFATATALLLRATGIPTRYAIGYSVHEYSSLEKKFIIRGKNAHAWNLVYIDGAWQQFDTTPSNWMSIESNATSSLVIIRDLFSLLGFKLAQFSAFITVISKTKSFWLVVIPLLSILIWWLLRNRQLNTLKLQRVIDPKTEITLIGIDSEIYAIERALQEAGLVRYDSESWQKWLNRLQEKQQLTTDLIVELKMIIKLHYRYRFDPQGLNNQERANLKSATESWLIKYQKFD